VRACCSLIGQKPAASGDAALAGAGISGRRALPALNYRQALRPITFVGGEACRKRCAEGRYSWAGGALQVGSIAAAESRVCWRFIEQNQGLLLAHLGPTFLEGLAVHGTFCGLAALAAPQTNTVYHLMYSPRDPTLVAASASWSMLRRAITLYSSNHTTRVCADC
jgi:hypothetical protein